MDELDRYCTQFASLHVKITNGVKQPNKAIMLLCVMDLVRCGFIFENKIPIDEIIKQAFSYTWSKYFDSNPPYVWTPFWHLKNESFWHFMPRNSIKDVNALAKPGETAPIGKMRESILYAYLDETLFELIIKKKTREVLYKTLLGTFINAMEKKDVPYETKNTVSLGQLEETTTATTEPDRGIKSKEKYHSSDKDLSKVSGTQKKTYKLLVEGLSPEEIASRRSLSVYTIYSHIALFIEKGNLQVGDFVNKTKYDKICEAIKIVGKKKKLIKRLCNHTITYHEINLVLASLRQHDIQKVKITSEKKEENNSNFMCFVEGISFNKSSKHFLKHDCRVVLSEFGYYLEVMGKYIKLAEYPRGFHCNEGSIWIKKPIIDKGYRIIHESNGNYNLIGYIKEAGNMIIFMDKNNREYNITLK